MVRGRACDLKFGTSKHINKGSWSCRLGPGQLCSSSPLPSSFYNSNMVLISARHSIMRVCHSLSPPPPTQILIRLDSATAELLLARKSQNAGVFRLKRRGPTAAKPLACRKEAVSVCMDAIVARRSLHAAKEAPRPQKQRIIKRHVISFIIIIMRSHCIALCGAFAVGNLCVLVEREQARVVHAWALHEAACGGL